MHYVLAIGLVPVFWLASSKTAITIRLLFPINCHWNTLYLLNWCQSAFNYSVHNYHVVTGVLGEVSLKRELTLSLKASVLHFNFYNRNSPVQPISANVIHQNDKYHHKIFHYQFTYMLVNSYKIILFDDVHWCHFGQSVS